MNELEYIVKSIDDYSGLNDYLFSHGFESEFNLQMNEGTTTSLNETFIHLYELEPIINRVNNLYLEFDTFRSNLFIGNKSNLDDLFYSSGHLVNNRHHNYFIPLWGVIKDLLSNLHGCQGIDITVNSAVKRINYLDHNIDGYLINLTLKVDNV